MSGTENASPPITFSPLLAGLLVPSLPLPLPSPLLLTAPVCQFARIVAPPPGLTRSGSLDNEDVFIDKIVFVSYEFTHEKVWFNSTVSVSVFLTDIDPLMVPVSFYLYFAQFSTVQLSLKVKKSEIIVLFIHLRKQINTLIKININFNQHGMGVQVNKKSFM